MPKTHRVPSALSDSTRARAPVMWPDTSPGRASASGGEATWASAASPVNAAALRASRRLIGVMAMSPCGGAERPCHSYRLARPGELTGIRETRGPCQDEELTTERQRRQKRATDQHGSNTDKDKATQKALPSGVVRGPPLLFSVPLWLAPSSGFTCPRRAAPGPARTAPR